MQLSLPSVKLPSRTGLLVMAGAGAAGVLGLLSTPVAVIIAAVPFIGANIPDEDASHRTSATSASPRRSTAKRRGAKRTTARRSTAKTASATPRAGAKRVGARGAKPTSTTS